MLASVYEMREGPRVVFVESTGQEVSVGWWDGEAYVYASDLDTQVFGNPGVRKIRDGHFGQQKPAVYEFARPSVAVVRNHYKPKTYFVCASSQQIAEAAAIVLQEDKDECADAELGALSEFLKKCWRDRDRWHRAQDWGVQHGLAPETYEVPHSLERYLGTDSDRPDSQVGEYLIPKSLPAALLAYNRLMYHMTVGERLVFFAQTKAEYDAEVEASKKEFSIEQANILEGMGLSTNKAWELIHLSGPSGAVACYRWIIDLRKIKDQKSLKTKLSHVANLSKKFYSWAAMVALFERFGVACPLGGYEQILRNLRVAQMFGLVGKKIKIVIKE